ncbi:hypothetical protein [Nocardia alni]|nr:hypothetical protein [Nocardia alni]
MEIARSAALLVRPDQIVAWRSPTAPVNPGATVESVLRHILHNAL